MYLFSPSTRGFYRRDVHGDNVPTDAVEISDEDHAALMDGQATGKVIEIGTSDLPELQDPAPPSADQLAAEVRARRDALLAASDWSQVRDVADATAALWQPYRQLLRAITAQPGFPSSVTWPQPPQ